MTIARVYKMTAAAGKGDALFAALQGLADALKGVEGLHGVDVMRDVDKPEHFLFVEKWASVQAHKDSSPSIPKEPFAPVMAAIADKPDSGYFQYAHQT